MTIDNKPSAELPIDLQQAYPGAPFTRRWAFDDALASSRLEGFKPDAEYLTIREEVIMKRMTTDEAIALFLAEALEADAKALLDSQRVPARPFRPR